MKHFLGIMGSLLLLCAPTAAAQNSMGNFSKIISENHNTLTLKTDSAILKIEFCADNIVRFRTSWTGFFASGENLMVTKYEWPKTNYTKKDNSNTLMLSTSKLRVEIQKSPLSIKILDNQGNILSQDSPNDTLGGHFTNGEMVGSIKKLFPDEHFFGFGERMDFLDRKGKKVTLNVGRGNARPHIIGAYNVLEANYSPIPFFMSTNDYGIFFHTSHATTWDMGSSDPSRYSFTAKGGELDYYFIQGENFPEILKGYTSITGTSPLLPKFALGLHIGTYSGGTWGHEEKTSTKYVVDLVKKFREFQIPLDVLHLDSTWRIFGENGGKGATSFEWRETFDDPEAMFDSLYAMDLNMVGLHLRPRFDNGKKLRLLDAAQEQGFVYPEKDNPGDFVNFFDPKAVDWWWENGVKRVAEQGAMFLKTDEGSAFGHKANESNKTGPTGKEIDSLHNLFPLVYAKAPYEKFAEYNGIRGMNQTREGYAGIQRYPYIFAGDWPSEWQYFEPVIKAGLNIGISGVGNWAHCMGGFEHIADPELYIRWCQFGLLSPVAHLFGMEHPNYKEPWNYGDQALSIFKRYDQMRYGLIPYLYSHSYEMYRTGMPLMRALVLAYQDDPNVYEITDQYLLGKSMMICPVTTKGAQTRVVYLPEGKWIDYWTGESHEGKNYLNVVCPIEQLPIFIKAGAIIPTQEPLNFIVEKEITEITLDIYPHEESSFQLYEDDGRSTAYQTGQYSTTEILSSDSSANTRITIKSPKGAFRSMERDYLVQVHLENRPAGIKINGKNYPLLEGDKINGSTAIYEKGVLRFRVADIKGETEIHIQKKS